MTTTVRRPEWAAAGTFAEAWTEALRTQERSRIEWHKALARAVVGGLRLAHVVTVDAEQVEALPEVFDTYEDSAAAFLDVELPFDPVYLSTDRVLLRRFAVPVRLLGVLVGRPTAMEGSHSGEVWDGRQPFVFPLIQIPGSPVPLWQGFGVAHSGRSGWHVDHMVDHMNLQDLPAPVGEYMQDSRSAVADAAEQAVKIVYFLESSNVELVDGPASRQEKRHVARKGGRIALTVRVREPKRRPRSGAEAQHVDYSHRWEVRGHYKHFPAGTRLADAAPEKLVAHGTLGLCRRVWCPPHVKGPQDKPLVPKVRVVS